jgi:polar amino acid transport system ATP-binding protein
MKLQPEGVVKEFSRRGPRRRAGRRDTGMTMLVATHEMSFARGTNGRVCFVDGGRIVESGPPAQVLGDATEPRTRQFLQRVIDAGRM